MPEVLYFWCDTDIFTANSDRLAEKLLAVRDLCAGNKGARSQGMGMVRRMGLAAVAAVRGAGSAPVAGTATARSLAPGPPVRAAFSVLFSGSRRVWAMPAHLNLPCPIAARRLVPSTAGCSLCERPGAVGDGTLSMATS
jgi:hypothetical protein